MATYHVSTAEALDFKEQPAVVYELKKTKRVPKIKLSSAPRTNEKVYVPPFAVISGILIFVLALMLISSTMQLGQQTRAINELNNKSISLSIANGKLQQQYTGIFTKELIEETAKKEGLVPASEVTVIYCDLSLPDSTTVYEEPSAGVSILNQINADFSDILGFLDN